MTLAAELAGAFVGGICSTFVSLAVLGPRFVRWYMKRKLGGMMNVTAASSFQPTGHTTADGEPLLVRSTQHDLEP